MADTITDRNVYILGAGASADAGAPLIKNFLDYSRELFVQPFSGLSNIATRSEGLKLSRIYSDAERESGM